MKKQSISSYHRQMVESIGRHEAGHYIIAKELGFKVGAISICITDLAGGHNAKSEIILSQGLTCCIGIQKFLESRVQVLYAGSLAESLSDHKIDHESALKIINDGGKFDYAKARELIHLIRNIKYPEANCEKSIQEGLDSIGFELWNKAAMLVEKDHEIINGLGGRLASEIRFEGQEFVLSEDELKKLPSIIKRFPITDENNTS